MYFNRSEMADARCEKEIPTVVELKFGDNLIARSSILHQTDKAWELPSKNNREHTMSRQGFSIPGTSEVMSLR